MVTIIPDDNDYDNYYGSWPPGRPAGGLRAEPTNHPHPNAPLARGASARRGSAQRGIPRREVQGPPPFLSGRKTTTKTLNPKTLKP